MDEYLKDVREHIHRVREILYEVIGELIRRAAVHDLSKYDFEESRLFSKVIVRARKVPYYSDEYKNLMEQCRPALEHHYFFNRHHPEHYTDGISGMNLIDVLEMLCDWVAASKQHPDSDIMKSMAINRQRFGIDDQLFSILVNTVRDLISSKKQSPVLISSASVNGS